MQHNATKQADHAFNAAIRALRLNVLDRVNDPHLNKPGAETLGDRIDQAKTAHEDRPRFRP